MNQMSFPVGARAFNYLVDHAPALPPEARAAVEQTGRNGAIAGTFYFVDAPEKVVLEVRDSLRRGAVEGGRTGRACDAGAAVIETKRRVAWYERACPRCGGSIRPQSWLTSGVFVLLCRECRWHVPE